MTYIYLVENCYGDSNKVYIGKTKNPTKRKNDHYETFGYDITYTIIDEINSLKKEDYIPIEQYWIHQFINWGFIVLNKNEGGAGVEYCSEEHKRKISESKRGKVWKWVNRKKNRGPLPEEHKKKISEANKGKMSQYYTEDVRKRMSENIKGKRGKNKNIRIDKGKPRKHYDNTNRGSRSEETKKKISESLKKHYGN